MPYSAITEGAADYTENYLGEFDAEHASELRDARMRAADLGIECVSAQVASLLELLAASIQAQAIIEVGTGTGISGAALLEGMKAGGVLTSIDLEAEYRAENVKFSDLLSGARLEVATTEEVKRYRGTVLVIANIS